MPPTISIIMPCLNGIRYLPAAIASVYAQTFEDWELIVIDDGSTDGSESLVRTMSDRDARIVLLRTSGRTGAAQARNHGLERARGRMVTFLDCDDWWSPTKLAEQMAAMADHGAGFCCSPYTVCDETGRALRLQGVDPPLTSRRYLRKNFVIGCLTVLVDTARIGTFQFPVHLQRAEDFLLWHELLLRCERQGVPALATSRPLAFYRVHGSGQSHNKWRHAQAHWQIYSRELRLPLPTALWCFASYILNGVLDRARNSAR